MDTIEECNALRDQLMIDRDIKVAEFNNLKTNGTPTMETYNALITKKIEIDELFTQKIHECNCNITEFTITEEEIQSRITNIQTMIDSLLPF
jgi:hypothetical protein